MTDKTDKTEASADDEAATEEVDTHEVPCGGCGRCADPSPDAELPARRDLLESVVKFSAVLAGLGLCASSMLMGAEAQAGPQEGGVNKKALQKLIRHAVDNGNMKAAVKRFGPKSGLKDEQLDMLLQVEREDLLAIREVKDRFRSALDDSGLAVWEVVEHNTNLK